MALKKVTLSFPARYALQTFLNRPRASLSMDSIMKGLEFYEKLGLSFIQDWKEKNTDEGGKLRYSEIFEVEGESVTVDIDEVYLTWLRGVLENHEWNTVVLPSGQKVIVGVATEFQVCIKSLWRAVNEALGN